MYNLSMFAEYIQPVCLPAYGQRLVDGQMGTVTGWGNVEYYSGSKPLTYFEIFLFYLIFSVKGCIQIFCFIFLPFFFFLLPQVIRQTFSRKQTSPSSAILCVTLLITMTTRSPPACSVLAMRKEASMPARSDISGFINNFGCFFFCVCDYFTVIVCGIRETAEVLLWLLTACLKAAAIACSEW